MKRIDQTLLFVILTFGVSFLAATLFRLSGLQYASTAGMIFATAYMFLPGLAALFVSRILHKEPLRQSLLLSFKFNRWFLIAWLLPPVLAFLSLGIGLLMPGVSFSPEMEGLFTRFADRMNPEQLEKMRSSLQALPVHLIWITLIQGLVAGVTINAIAGLGEEAGWRGFLTQRFKNLPFIKAALLTGLLWGLWHAPVILMGHNYPSHPRLGVLMMTLWCILLSPLFLYITLKARSAIAAAILHGTLNATAGIGLMLLKGGNDLTVGVTGLSGFLALILITKLFYIYDRFISRENIMSRKVGETLRG